MIFKTVGDVSIDGELIKNYFAWLVGSFFKILPLYERKEPSLKMYMENLRDELSGCAGLILAINNDAQFMSLLATLQYLIDNSDYDDCTQSKYKQKVFGAISVCNKLSDRYGSEAGT